MKISMSKLFALEYSEIIFIFTMMRAYGGMADPENNSKNIFKNGKKRNGKRNSKNKRIEKVNLENPNLYNFSDPKWEECQDEKFLIFKEIIKKVQI